MPEFPAIVPDEPATDDRRAIELLRVKELWMLEDLCLYLNRTPEAVRSMRKLGNLPPATRLGKRLYWIRTEIEQWVRDNRESDDYEPGPPPKRTRLWTTRISWAGSFGRCDTSPSI